MLRGLVFIFLLALAVPAAGDITLRPDSFVFSIEGRCAFVQSKQNMMVPRYYCDCIDTPILLPSQSADQLCYQMLRGNLGISVHKETKNYVVKKLAQYQAIFVNGKMETRMSERVVEFPAANVKDTATALDMTSDLPDDGSTETRSTVVHLDKTTKTGSIRIIRWATADRKQPPAHDNTYHFQFFEVP